jgi:hypothetical protein
MQGSQIVSSYHHSAPSLTPLSRGTRSSDERDEDPDEELEEDEEDDEDKDLRPKRGWPRFLGWRDLSHPECLKQHVQAAGPKVGGRWMRMIK